MRNRSLVFNHSRISFYNFKMRWTWIGRFFSSQASHLHRWRDKWGRLLLFYYSWKYKSVPCITYSTTFLPATLPTKSIWRGVVGFKPSPLALHWDDITAKEWGALTFSEACLTCCIIIHGMICNWVVVFFTKILFWLGTSFFQMLLGCLTKECVF